jgi:hypothetical protein
LTVSKANWPLAGDHLSSAPRLVADLHLDVAALRQRVEDPVALFFAG